MNCDRRAISMGSVFLLLHAFGLSLAADDQASWKRKAASTLTFSEEERGQFFGKSERLFRVKGAVVAGEVGRGVALRILTRLPTGTRLDVALHFAGKQIGWGEPARVDQGEAVAFFGPYLERRLLSGEYACSIHYDPSKQSMDILEAPGVPLEEKVVRCRIRAGTDEDETRERSERRRFYRVYLRKVSLLENELQENYEATFRRQRFVIGSGGMFDHSAWREWLVDWRDRFHRKVFLEIMRARDDGVVALRYPEAYTAIQGLYRWNLLLSKSLSREIYHKFGKAVHPEDTPGEDQVSLTVIRQRIETHRGAFERVFGRPGRNR